MVLLAAPTPPFGFGRRLSGGSDNSLGCNWSFAFGLIDPASGDLEHFKVSVALRVTLRGDTRLSCCFIGSDGFCQDQLLASASIAKKVLACYLQTV